MDWADIKPLTENEARKVVKNYLESQDYKCKDVGNKSLPPNIQSPDFEVLKDNKLIFYCEVKTPEHKLDPTIRMYRWDTTFYKIKKLVHKAVKQLDDYDRSHTYPHVIAFTSNHPQLDWHKFIHTVVGAVIYNNQVIRDLRVLSHLNNWDKDLPDIDMVLWFQVNYLDKTAFRLDYLLNGDSKLFESIDKISETLKPIVRR